MGRSSRRCFGALSLPLALASCHGCKNDHPFVPYSIDGESPPPALDAAPDAALDVDAASFGDTRVMTAPPGASRWTLDGMNLVAPDGKVFALGMTGDFDGDGTKDAVVLLRDATGPDEGEPWVYKGGVSGVPTGVRIAVPKRSAVASPDGTLRDPSCSPVARLGRIGPHAALVELGALCAESGGSPSGAKSRALDGRWIGILELRREPKLLASATLTDPEGAPRLTVDAESWDFDKDGLDDLLLRVTLEGGGPPFEPGPKVSAVVRWLDRPTGLSREADEPEASIHALASLAMARAQKPREAASVPILVHQARALFLAMCAEGRAPRLTHVLGDHPIACGTSHALEELALAETRAYVTLGDPLRAAAALDLAGIAPSTRTAARITEAKGWIEKIAAPVLAATLRAVLAVPESDRARPPSWGALAFEATGKLLVRTPVGVVRMDPALGDEADAGVPKWRPEVLSADGARRFLDVYDACDGFALRATVASLAGNDVKDVALPIAPKLGPRCEGTRGMAVRGTPLAWGPLGLETIVLGYPVLISSDLSHAIPLASPLGQPENPGSPRSPDGKSLVVPTGEGLLVTGTRTRLFRAKELEGAYSELYDCAVSDDATRVACIRGGRAFVGIWP